MTRIVPFLIKSLGPMVFLLYGTSSCQNSFLCGWTESPWGMWEGCRSPQTECVSAGRVAGRGVPTHQRRLCLLYLHRTFVKLCCLLEVTLFIAIYKNKTKQNNCSTTIMIKLVISWIYPQLLYLNTARFLRVSPTRGCERPKLSSYTFSACS